MFSGCEMPASPWQPIQSSAFSLPAVRSAACADDQQTRAATDNIQVKLIRITISPSSLPGLTRQSISLARTFLLMDARILSTPRLRRALGARPPKLDCEGGKSGHEKRVPSLVVEIKSCGHSFPSDRSLDVFRPYFLL